MRHPVAALLVLAALGSARAATPITGPTVITTSGTYYLASSLTFGAEEGDFLVIAADSVVLELRGRTLTLTSPWANAVRIAAPSRTVTILGSGTIRGGRAAVSGTLTGTLKVERLTALGWTEGGVEVSAKTLDVSFSRLEGVADEEDGHGIRLAGTGARALVRNTTIRNWGRYGILLAGVTSGEIRDNLLEDQGVQVGGWGGAIRIQGSALRVLDNRTRRTAGPGLFLTGPNILVAGNAFEQATEWAVTLGSGNVLHDNRVTGCGRDSDTPFCVIVGSNNVLRRNVVDAGQQAFPPPDGAGIKVDGDGNAVFANTVRRHVIGLWFFPTAESNAYRGNRLSENLEALRDQGVRNVDLGGNVL